MTDAEEFLQDAIELIEDSGNDLTLQQFTYGYDASELKNTLIPDPPIPFKGAFEAYQNEEIGGQVQAGDIKVIAYHVDGVTYKIDQDKVIFDGVTYTLKNVSPVATQNQIIINELQLRR